MKKKNKHDFIVKKLEERLTDNNFYDLVVSHINFPPGSNYKQGECDLLTIKKYSDGRKVLLLFEVKSSDKYENKVREQLGKAIKCFYSNEFSKVYTFRVYGNKKDNDYNIERILFLEQSPRKTKWFFKKKNIK